MVLGAPWIDPSPMLECFLGLYSGDYISIYPGYEYCICCQLRGLEGMLFGNVN